MPQLLIELFSEEIPARMQARAQADLIKAVTGALTEAGLSFDESFAFSGPRRLGMVVEGLMARSQDVREERKGPKLDAPEKAIAGFLRGAGLESIDQAERRSDPKKGEFYVAVLEKPGRPAQDIIAEMMPEIIRSFHWPKSMRTGHGHLRWVRPLQRIVCVLDGETVPFEVDGIASGNRTEGHRVHGRGPFTVTGWADYKAQLEGEGHVLLTREARRKVIAETAAKVCKVKKLDLVEDAGLLEELVGLAEWPVVLMGDMDPAFLELPPEVIRLSMRTHQKYFAVRDPKTGDLAPHFVVVANIEAADGGAKIAAGNAKVLSARLEDARFFWANDVGRGLEDMGGDLARIAFKEELGSMADKTARVAALARELAPKVAADPDLAETAARLAKADLVSEMVYEFPELQGVMGRYYALAAGVGAPSEPHARPTSPASGGGSRKEGSVSSSPAGGGSGPEGVEGGLLEGLGDEQLQQVADAIADHYKPQGPADAVPTAPVSIAVALADKLDTLVGFWAIDERPTGSKDPFALRRAALGVVRLVLENGVRLSLNEFGRKADFGFAKMEQGAGQDWSGYGDDLLAFFADRLKQVLRDEGKRHDLIDAVFALGAPRSGEAGDRPPAGQAAPAEAPAQRAAVSANDDLVLIVKRVEALTEFLASEDGENLLAGYKRAANILKAEEKKDGREYHGDPDPARFTEKAERDLHLAINLARSEMEAALAREDFEGAMAALAKLRAPVDAFFDEVMVNAEDAALRENRLLILAAIRDALHGVADFSKIEG